MTVFVMNKGIRLRNTVVSIMNIIRKSDFLNDKLLLLENCKDREMQKRVSHLTIILLIK